MLARLFKTSDRIGTENEIEEEFNFHIELIRRDFIQRGMSAQEAETATINRFGDVNSVRKECVEIRRRNRLLIRTLKSFLSLTLLAGITVRLLSADFHVGKAGEMLIAIAVLGQLLVYAHNSRPSTRLK
jgi:hypothetical protein